MGSVLVLAANGRVRDIGSAGIYDSASQVPRRDVGLVLGCSKAGPSGGLNQFFTARIAAAAELYRQGRVRALIVSGDNHWADYDEPTDMKEALKLAGVPECAVYCDYAGFRTLDSVIRARKVFGQSRMVVVSQRFHNERALYMARQFGMDAVALNAAGIAVRSAPLTYAREVLARVAAVLDVEWLGTRPRFLGDPVSLK